MLHHLLAVLVDIVSVACVQEPVNFVLLFVQLLVEFAYHTLGFTISIEDLLPEIADHCVFLYFLPIVFEIVLCVLRLK